MTADSDLLVFSFYDLLLISSRGLHHLSWPDAVFRNNPTPPSNAAWLRQNPGVTTVAQRIKPRYHLAGGQGANE